MRPRNRVSEAGLDLVKRFEGYRRQAAQLPDGRWTIGYGHTLTARAGAEVSEADAEALLLYDLNAASKLVDELVFTPLTQNQFDALCSFAFNLGPEQFRASEVLKRLNEGQLVQAACAMELWRKAEFEGEDIVIDALVRRRAAEKILFLTPPGSAFVPAPSPVLRPKSDPDAGILVPASEPAEISTTLYGARIIVTRDGAPALPPEIPEPEIAPADRLTAAAEAVTARLETLFADKPGWVADPPSEPQFEGEDEPHHEPPPVVEPEPELEADGAHEPQADEKAFMEAFVDAPSAPEPEAQQVAAEPPAPPPQAPSPTITPIVMSYPFEAPVSPELTIGAPPPPPAAPPEPFESAPEPEEVVAEPLEADEPSTEANLWGDDEPFVAPAAEAELADDDLDELELDPASEAPRPAEDDYGLDPFVRRPSTDEAAPPPPAQNRPAPSFTIEDNAVRDFLPQRPARAERSREPGLLTDLFLALLGIAFFGFAVFWALNAKVDPTGPGVHPSLIAWPTGFIGIGFVVVAIFRLLERLGDAADRD